MSVFECFVVMILFCDSEGKYIFANIFQSPVFSFFHVRPVTFVSTVMFGLGNIIVPSVTYGCPMRNVPITVLTADSVAWEVERTFGTVWTVVCALTNNSLRITIARLANI